MNNSRREALIGISGLALATTSTLFATNESKKENIISVPWNYKKLDSDIVAVRAYKGYHKNGCMYATFEAIIGTLGDKFGSPYSTFPFDMMKYGAGGIAGWGTLCGALNGAAAAIGLLSKTPKKLIDELLKFSQKITIVAGSLLSEEGIHYNVTYMFSDGKYEVAKKLVLVPFGEYIPLPKFARKFINDTFFAGASDFKTASKPTDFIINGVKFRNAICYEATCQEIHEGELNYVIAMSNNAWFSPSIEPTLQKLLMRFYARKNGVIIYHSANWKGTGIIK